MLRTVVESLLFDVTVPAVVGSFGDFVVVSGGGLVVLVL